MSEKTLDIIKEIIEWIVCILIALVVAILFRYFVGTPTIVQQPSMYPTLKQDQRLLLNRWVRTIKKMPNRGDIITFESPSELVLSEEELSQSVIARYENKPNSIFKKFSYYILEINKTSYIKRVVGLPSDHVVIKDGKVFINDNELDEDYLQDGIVTDNGKGNCIDLIVPENTVFVMGDNRAQSADSRRFGCIPLENIEGKVWIRVWPLNLFGKVD